MAAYLDSADDKTLWQAFKSGDENAFTTLYQQHVRVLFSYGKKLISDEETVEDAIQDLFADLWQTRVRLGDVESIRFYLFRCLRRRLHKSLRSNQISAESWELTDELLLPVSPPQETNVIQTETLQSQTSTLQARLKELPLRQYEVLMLHYYQDFSYSEIATILDINEQSARNLVQRALHKLRQAAFLVCGGALLLVSTIFLLK